MINKIIEDIVAKHVSDPDTKNQLVIAIIAAVQKFIGGSSMNRMGATIMTESSSISADKKTGQKPLSF